MNGESVLLLVEKLGLARNPGWSREQIAQEYRRTLGVDTVIWLGKGLYEEEIRERLPGGLYAYGAGGHVDTFARFADPRTILLAEVTSEERDRDPILRERFSPAFRTALPRSPAWRQLAPAAGRRTQLPSRAGR